MLELFIPETELWDEKEQVFINTKKQVLRLEHSLVSLSKWEAKWQKPFLSNEDKTIDETIDYIRCMTMTQNVDKNVYLAINNTHIKAVNEYIERPMTATTIRDMNSPKNTEIITSEIIYYWMITLGIPFECQKWHLNRLLMLIRVCNLKNQPEKKMSINEVMKSNSQLNEERKKKLRTSG